MRKKLKHIDLQLLEDIRHQKSSDRLVSGLMLKKELICLQLKIYESILPNLLLLKVKQSNKRNF